MKILHTSDWHLGRTLYGKKRYVEFEAFLSWLTSTIQLHQIDTLLIAGDVFDTSTPSHRSQELYYRFLCDVSGTCCRHIIVIAGNHDSPSFLNAPKSLLRALNVHVVGAITESPEDEVITLYDESNTPQAIVCAVPYLRDKDIRKVEPGETLEDKNIKLVEGVKQHYNRVCSIAEGKQKNFENAGYTGIPIIAMGHLFTMGGKTIEGDGVRELYVGSLAHVGKDVFPSSIDYLALGHLHIPQCVAGTQHIRYCGSPIPMGYGEASQQKKVVIVEFKDSTTGIHELEIPCFQKLERVSGSLDVILVKIDQLKLEKSSAWLEIEYIGKDVISNLREVCNEAVVGTEMEIRRIKNKRVIDKVMCAMQEEETLDDLDVSEVFKRCLDAHNVPNEKRTDLINSYNEIIKSLYEKDINAE
ncbi:exonuclease SbcCD subunit D C-terminal domain-containing protein [Zooshikella marina]|uniref:exonuclease SbcCD subunit D C-terminal domain-containing protein n=1 Tax=Zooshikella ganghwensis TaxID=202772 RepID=UPI001BAEE2D4|nr:exonuclease SbcCD subunit D C-terminal domain-containing protein [Zooshikella ganghwensis]MBU2709013.1 exonuclease SbcCD subunit D C-terminal domain-containing protein [Zooshikella ganghwensis]